MTIGLDLRADVARMLLDHGRDVTITLSAPTSYDPATGQSSSTTPDQFAGRARIGDYRNSQINGVNVLQLDRRATFQPADWSKVPAIGHRMVAGDSTYNVVNVMIREHGGDLICYTLQLRR